MAGSASRTKASASASSAGEVLQFKVWLMGVSPLQVPPEMTLRELHGTLQVAIGWESLHLYQFVLRGKRHGSWLHIPRDRGRRFQMIVGTRFA